MRRKRSEAWDGSGGGGVAGGMAGDDAVASPRRSAEGAVAALLVGEGG